MTQEDSLWAQEERFWTEGAGSARSMTAKGAVFVFPYPEGILQGQALWSEKQVAQRWRTIEMTDQAITVLADMAVLAYRVSAERGEEPIYEAFCTSTYVRDNDKWLRMAHQQTPVT